MRCAESWRIASAWPGSAIDGFDRLSAHALRVGFITEAYDKGVRDEDIMRHTRHRDLRTMRGYVRRAGLVTRKPRRGARPLMRSSPLSLGERTGAGRAAGAPDPEERPAKRRGRRPAGHGHPVIAGHDVAGLAATTT